MEHLRRDVNNDDHSVWESKYYKINPEEYVIDWWSIYYTKFRTDGRTDYYISKKWDPDKQTLVDRSITNYKYSDKFVEAWHGSREEDKWTFHWISRSNQRKSAVNPNRFLADSVVDYTVTYDPINDKFVRDQVLYKVYLFYDSKDMLKEFQIYEPVEGQLALRFKVTIEYQDYHGERKLVGRKVYEMDDSGTSLYKVAEGKYFYYPEGQDKGWMFLNFDVAGDTVEGRLSEENVLSRQDTIRADYEWHSGFKDWQLENYEVRRHSKVDEDRFITQTSDTWNSWGTYTNRSMMGYGDYPGVFNDGPVLISPGDTVLFYVSGRNFDMSVPDISVTNIPQTATYNPETRRFFWIVDELDPEPMLYTATHGNNTMSTQVRFTTDRPTDEKEPVFIARQYHLGQNYPNPFNPSTTINFELAQSGPVTLAVYNIVGQRVATILANQHMEAGPHTVNFNGSSLSSGIYLYNIQTRDYVETKKMMLVK